MVSDCFRQLQMVSDRLRLFQIAFLMVSDDFRWLQMVSDCSRWLQMVFVMVLDGFKSSQMAPDGFRWLQVISDGFWWLQMDSDGSRLFWMVSKGLLVLFKQVSEKVSEVVFTMFVICTDRPFCREARPKVRPQTGWLVVSVFDLIVQALSLHASVHCESCRTEVRGSPHFSVLGLNYFQLCFPALIFYKHKFTTIMSLCLWSCYYFSEQIMAVRLTRKPGFGVSWSYIFFHQTSYNRLVCQSIYTAEKTFKELLTQLIVAICLSLYDQTIQKHFGLKIEEYLIKNSYSFKLILFLLKKRETVKNSVKEEC